MQTFSLVLRNLFRNLYYCRSLTNYQSTRLVMGGELINKKEFPKAMLNKRSKAFMIHLMALKVEASIHSLRAALKAALYQDTSSTQISTEYTDYIVVFSPNLPIGLLKSTGNNEHVIELVEDKQPSYEPIYTLSLVELETLKIYIKTHLKARFI